MINAVIFDMNGIIIDDEDVHELAFQKVAEQYNINLSHDDYLNLCAGKTDKAGFESIAEKFDKNIDIVNALRDKSSFYLKLFPENKKSYPGVIELIKKLSKVYRLALTSSSSKAEIDLIVREFGIKDCFRVVVSADDVTKGKPDPEPYLLTAQKLSINPAECVVIEDSRSGVLSAKAAGMKCIGVTTTHTKEALEKADLVAMNFDEVEKLIK